MYFISSLRYIFPILLSIIHRLLTFIPKLKFSCCFVLLSDLFGLLPVGVCGFGLRFIVKLIGFSEVGFSRSRFSSFLIIFGLWNCLILQSLFIFTLKPFLMILFLIYASSLLISISLFLYCCYLSILSTHSSHCSTSISATTDHHSDLITMIAYSNKVTCTFSTQYPSH